MQAEIRAGLWEKGVLSGAFGGEKMAFAGLSLDQGRIDFAGSRQEQNIGIGVSGDLGELKVKASATYRENWMGEITGLQLNTRSYGSWRQQRDAPFTVLSDGVALDTICATDGEGSICAGGEMEMAEPLRWKVRGSLASVPLAWLNRLKLLKLPVSGVIHADIGADGDSRTIASATVEASLPEAEIELEVEDDEFSSIHWSDTLLSLRLADAQLNGEFSTRMKNGSQVRATAAIPGMGDFARPANSLPLTGRLDLNNFDIAVLSAVTGYGVEPTGRVNSSLVLGGTLGEPHISGDGRIEGGGIALPYQGITLENVSTSIVAGEDGAKIVCRATSGPGELNAEGTIRYGHAGVEGELKVRGKNFLLVNLPEYTLRVTPDVLFRF
ncbi:MAG: hypothetical protein ACD_75C02295G0001, partial [uncultured bacterium]